MLSTRLHLFHFRKYPLPPRAVSPNECYILDGQNTQLRSNFHRQTAQLLDGSPEIRLQIPYLEEFFDTMVSDLQ